MHKVDEARRLIKSADAIIIAPGSQDEYGLWVAHIQG